MTTRETVDQELTQYLADALRGALTLEDYAKACQAIRTGAVSVRRDAGGTILATVGAVAAVELHIFDLPSVAAQWEAFWQAH